MEDAITLGEARIKLNRSQYSKPDPETPPDRPSRSERHEMLQKNDDASPQL
jgi:hypothetical protein